MRKPNGYGNIKKLSGKRRQPYAVRTSSIVCYISISGDIDAKDCETLIRCGFKYDTRRDAYIAKDAENTRVTADKMASRGYMKSFFAKQEFQYLKYFEKQADAAKFLAEYNSGSVIAEDRKFTDTPTFAEIYDMWKEYRHGLKNDVTPAAWHNYDLAFKHLTPLHNRKISSIRASEIQDTVNLYSGKSQSTIAPIRTVLRGVYTYAEANRYITENPIKYIVFEYTASKTPIHKIYTDEEIQLLWDNLGKIKNVDIILMFIYTGMRPSELLEIRTENIHLDEQYMIGGMKTKAGRNRIIPICDKILPLVRARYNKDNEFLILNTHKNPYSYRPFWDDCHTPLMKKLGLDHLPHDTRHTFITLMDRAGVDESIIKLIVGHSLKSNITKDVYTHKTPEELLKEVNKI